MANSTITVKVGDEDREIFMSYGLLTAIAGSVPSIEQVPNLFTDPGVLNNFLNALLAVRDAKGKVVTEGFEVAAQLGLEDLERVLEWGQDHLLDFFTRRALKAQEQAKRVTSTLEQSSLSGTLD